MRSGMLDGAVVAAGFPIAIRRHARGQLSAVPPFRRGTALNVKCRTVSGRARTKGKLIVTAGRWQPDLKIKNARNLT